MEVRLQRPQREDLSIRFTLAPFITEWVSTQANFIAAIAQKFGDWLSVRPQDFSSNPSGNLGEAWCMYRIFGGASTIVLRPDALELNFVNVNDENETDRGTITEIIRRSGTMLQQDIGSYARCYVSVTSKRHAEIAEDRNVDHYLSQFALKETADMVKTDSDIEYSPTAKIILSHKGGEWSVQRLVEKSDLLPDGLFVHTLIFIPSFELAKVDKQRKVVNQIDKLANKSVGLRYVGDSDADVNS